MENCAEKAMGANGSPRLTTRLQLPSRTHGLAQAIEAPERKRTGITPAASLGDRTGIASKMRRQRC